MSLQLIISEINRIKELFGINEAMVASPQIEYDERNNHYLAIIAIDTESNERYLVLSVNLTTTTNPSIYEYSYGFSVHDPQLQIVGPYLYGRSEVNKYIPVNLRGNVMPIILQMTEKLVNKIRPNIIQRKTVEALSGDSLKRYDKITSLLVDTLGYKVKNEWVDMEGKTHWDMIRRDSTEISVDENYVLTENENYLVELEKTMREVLSPENIKDMVDRFHQKNPQFKR